MIEIIYRVRIKGSDSKYRQILIHLTEGEYEVVEGVHESYCDQFSRPYTEYDFATSRKFGSLFDAEDYARKRFFEIQNKEAC